jgi:DNA-binding response OmpR family regulator
VDVHIAALRKKLEDDSRYPRFLLTVKGIGYRLAV